MLEVLNTLLWGPGTLTLILGTGAWLTLRTGGFPQRNLGWALALSLGREARRKGRGGVSPFGSLMTALASTVGTGNIVGASGVAGISAVTGAKPDGYTLGVTPSAPLAMHPHMRKVPYTLDSFDFVGRILKAPYIVMVAKTAPWNTLDDMLRDMKTNPNTFFFASSGVGSVPYFAMMDLFKKAGAQVRHVPFSGDADAFQAIAGNRV